MVVSSNEKKGFTAYILIVQYLEESDTVASDCCYK